MRFIGKPCTVAIAQLSCASWGSYTTDKACGYFTHFGKGLRYLYCRSWVPDQKCSSTRAIKSEYVLAVRLPQIGRAHV